MGMWGCVCMKMQTHTNPLVMYFRSDASNQMKIRSIKSYLIYEVDFSVSFFFHQNPTILS